MKNICILLLSLVLVALTSGDLISQCDREKIIEEYETYFLGTQVSSDDLRWSGDVSQCQPGTISNLAIQRMLARLNYFRRLAHVSSEVGLDTSLLARCQQAALMMHSNNKLSHKPPANWSCYSDDGVQAASKSNLALGAHSVHALSLYMYDHGAKNGAVGHRRWMLYSRAKDFGMGSTSRAHAMYVIHTRQDAPEDLHYITYPSEGIFPEPLLPDRWSFSIPKAKFAGALVTMEDEDGHTIPLTILEVKNGFGDNTIVWEPEPGTIEKFAPYDRTYRINISNVGLSDSTADYQYHVTIAPVTHPPDCRPGLSWKQEECHCVQSQTSAMQEHELTPFSMHPNPASSHLYVRALHPSFQGRELAFTLLNAYGQPVLRESRKTVEVLRTGISIRHLPNGLYFLHINNQVNLVSQPLLIQH